MYRLKEGYFDEKEFIKTLFEEKGKIELFIILTDCCVYEIVHGKIIGRFDQRNQGLSIIKGD